MNNRTLKLIVVIHFVVVVMHSIAHEVLKVKATTAQLAFIIPVIIVAPVVAGVMLRKFNHAGTIRKVFVLAFRPGVHSHAR